jgi:hypothetical protein
MNERLYVMNDEAWDRYEALTSSLGLILDDVMHLRLSLGSLPSPAELQCFAKYKSYLPMSQQRGRRGA